MQSYLNPWSVYFSLSHIAFQQDPPPERICFVPSSCYVLVSKQILLLLLYCAVHLLSLHRDKQKPQIDRLLVGWVTTSLSRLLYVFVFLLPFLDWVGRWRTKETIKEEKASDWPNEN